MTWWHYAVHVGGHYYQPACTGARYKLEKDKLHGVTKLRGEVNCPDCLKAMGIS